MCCVTYISFTILGWPLAETSRRIKGMIVAQSDRNM